MIPVGMATMKVHFLVYQADIEIHGAMELADKADIFGHPLWEEVAHGFTN